MRDKEYKMWHENKRMYGCKNILALLLFVFVASCACAQDEDTTQKPFFYSKKFVSTAYVQAGVAATHMVGSAAATTHFSLHWVINHKYVVGANYHILSSRENITKLTYPDAKEQIYLTHNFAGLSFGYILFHDKKFSLQPELAAGWSNIRFTQFDTVTTKRNLAGIIPAVYGIWNATHIFRIGVGLNYRLIVGEPFKELKTQNLSGVGGMVFLRFGKF
jgi:hypothetical protein